MNSLYKLIEKKINQLESFSINFQFNGISVYIGADKHLFDQNQILIKLMEEYEYKKYLNENDVEYKKIYKNELEIFHNLGNDENFNKKLNLDQDFMGNKYKFGNRFRKLLFGKGLKKDFWSVVFEKIKSVSPKEKLNVSIAEHFKFDKDERFKKGIYIFRLERKRMSNSQKLYLINQFQLDRKYLDFLQRKNLTVATRNKPNNKHVQLYWRLKNKDRKIEDILLVQSDNNQ